jgi:hypothetical protein
MISHSKSGSSIKNSRILSQTPLSRHRKSIGVYFPRLHNLAANPATNASRQDPKYRVDKLAIVVSISTSYPFACGQKRLQPLANVFRNSMTVMRWPHKRLLVARSLKKIEKLVNLLTMLSKSTCHR